MLVKSSFKDASYKEHFHTEYSIALITKGEVCFVVDGEEFVAKEGDIRVFNPYEVHSIKKSSWSHINLSLKVKKLEGIRYKNVIKDDKLKELFLQMCFKKEFLKEFKDRLKKHTKDSSNQLKKDGFEKIILYMEANLDEIFDMDILANIYGSSKYHFLREFKKEFGITPYSYIQILKISKFRDSLRKGNLLSVSSFEAGFCDQSHLIRTYKKFFGHTPSKISNIIL